MLNVTPSEIEKTKDIVKYFTERGFVMSIPDLWKIAVQIRRNEILSEALMVGMGTPGAIEAIAIELGAGSAANPSIKDAAYSIATAISGQ